ncbi:5-methylcytosine-specific restriction endonuclease system specificity protein McrC [Mesorhizobium sp. M2E.F.Ca.ET.219.01.1.1]|uniref:5-methylcytosine-specific restriction endonuclease system specificity protein McrC n=1 Tax=Mesorhizobium sp. M2E.F.Ca.ET.219.01.1.1 TaxID=2500530 RepID=UPI000FDAACEE|nr:5-methylcytosine-specific restriction endonuclease system specificity protein McrC [Mesorhizobium sp. M2E.F.Ca.ET.219.01.1.1]TGQ04500.1 5-methylcytosine-specific restriction endonuclease system specificity protein McrC [Mesorhizobium sp. M2E.F.Ca.ET.219.01.1.1]
MQATTIDRPGEDASRLIGGIPVRNIWLLFLYAHNLAQLHGQHAAAVEDSPDFPSLIGRILCYAVDRRLRRNLSRGYLQKRAVLARVRGRIDILDTFAGDLLSKGMVACRFEEFTFDTPRNRLVRAALDSLANRLDDWTLAHECRRLAGDLGRQGVGGIKPSRAELSADRIGRHDADDLLMVTLARLVFDLVLPTEDSGGHTLTRVEKDIVLVRHLFEKAIGNFYAAELPHLGWKVHQGKFLKWQIESETRGIAAIMPGMISDIILEHAGQGKRLIIDTKFTSVFGRSQHRAAVLKSGYIYQLYAYLRSQERADNALSLTASGMFIHPSIDTDVNESVRIQGHELRFVTVDLAQSTSGVIQRLRDIVLSPRTDLVSA